MNEDIEKYEKEKLKKLKSNNPKEYKEEFAKQEKKKIERKKKASLGWIIAGFIFSFLGGWGGIAIGLNYAFGKYEKETKTLGWVMAIIGFFSMAIWKSI